MQPGNRTFSINIALPKDVLFSSQTLRPRLRRGRAHSGNPCCTIMDVVLSRSCLFPSAPDGSMYGGFWVFWSLPRAMFSCQPIQKAMVGGPHSFSVCLQEAVRVGSTVVRGIPAPEVHLEGSRILPRMRSRVPVPAERWLHVTSPTMPQIKTLPPRSFAINRRILRECLRMAGFRH